MDLDEILPKRTGDPLAALLAQDIDALSVAELEARIAALEGEVGRTKSKLEHAARHRVQADNLFKS